MSKRKIKPRILQGFDYQGPKIRRNRPEKDEELKLAKKKSVHQSEEKNPDLDQDPDQNQEADLQQENPPTQSPPNSPQETDPQNSPQNDPLPQQNSKTTAHYQNQTEEPIDQLLSKLYKFKKSPAAYSGALQKFIDKNYSLSLHKQRRKKFLRRPFVIYDPYDAIQADIVFYNQSQYYTQNSYYKYILTTIGKS